MFSIFASHADSTRHTFCWMPAGRHQLTAGTLDGTGFFGPVICDEDAAQNIIASFHELRAKKQPLYIDFDHEDSSAAGWVKDFSWDPSIGILCTVEWTPGGAR